MILNHLRATVWDWNNQAESKCPMCGEPLVARRCQDRVWHWAHRPYTNQKKYTCLFDDSPWALKWRLGYLMYKDWQIEVPKHLPLVLSTLDILKPCRIILIHAIKPVTQRMLERGEKGKVREFVTHISDDNEDRFKFLLGANNHEVLWFFNGKEQARALAKAVGKDEERKGYKYFLKPKAQALYERIVAAGQTALVHLEGSDGSTLYKEWVKPAINAQVPAERTGVWFPMTGAGAVSVLENYSNVTLPYDSNNEKAASKAASRFSKLVSSV